MKIIILRDLYYKKQKIYFKIKINEIKNNKFFIKNQN